MITFTRNTTYAVELDGPARELASFARSLSANEGVIVQICHNDDRAGVAFFDIDSPFVEVLPPIGTTWTTHSREEVT